MNCGLLFFWASISLLFLDNVNYVPQNVSTQSTLMSVFSPSDTLNGESFITIGGIPQWVSITGNRTKPAILFVHGGPGSPISPYADAIFQGWGKDFVLIQWDQRGAGKTFGHSDPPEELTPEYLNAHPLTVEQMVADGIELAEYLTKHLGKEKLVLFGSSWGSALGAKMATQRPDLFHSYIGHSQLVNPSEDLKFVYQKVFEMASKAKDEKSLETLKTLGSPPYDQAKNTGQLLRIVKQYEAKNSAPAPESWWKPATGYDSEKDFRDRYNGDDYSFINYAGHKPLGIKPMMSTINLGEDALNFKIPVYFIQGATDILTPREITMRYFNRLNAPEKEYIVLPNAAHGFNRSVIDKVYELLTQYMDL